MLSITPVSSAVTSAGSARVSTPSTPSTVVAQTVSQASSSQTGDVSKQQPTAKQVEMAVSNANAQIAGQNEQVSFGFVKELGQLIVQVTDKSSGEVIRQIPSKEFIAQQIAAKNFIGKLLDKQR